MNWQEIVQKARAIRETLEISHKCLNIDRPVKEETVSKHIGILTDTLENIRVLLNVNYRETNNSFFEASSWSPDASNSPWRDIIQANEKPGKIETMSQTVV